jgi:hypothetical protein
MQRRPPARPRALAIFAGAFFSFVAVASGCSAPETSSTGAAAGTSGGGGDSDGGSLDAGSDPVTVTLHPNAPPLVGETACAVVEVTNLLIPDAHHVTTCSHVAYATNPPSGGPHWPAWAARGAYPDAVRRELFVHNLEHGWVVLAYRCKEACPDVVAALQKTFDEAADPYCIAHGDPLSRVILTPDPLLETPIAVSAWGATYTATCLDPPSIADFIAKRIGRGPEMICGGGQLPSVASAGCITP